MDKVSIITPCYNSELNISNTIKSILNQSYENWELLLIDDNSNDKTIRIIEKFNDKRIKLFKNSSNIGTGPSRNVGIKNSSGKFICFCDSDDIWLRDKLKIQLNFMKMHNFPISYTSYYIINEAGEETGKIIKSIEVLDYYKYLKTTIIGLSTSMINTHQVKDLKFLNLRTRQDTYLWISLLKKGFKAYGINKPLVKYRVHNKSISYNKISAARMVWYLYYNLEKMGFLRSLYYFSHYAISSLKKKFL